MLGTGQDRGIPVVVPFVDPTAAAKDTPYYTVRLWQVLSELKSSFLSMILCLTGDPGWSHTKGLSEFGLWNSKPDNLAPMGRVFVFSALALFVLLVWAGEVYDWIQVFKTAKKHWEKRRLRKI
jgi:hypothetical protein